MADAFDPYYEWLGIPPSDQPPNHYRLLGIGLFEENAAVIAHAADRQMGHLRGFASGKHSKLSQELLNELARARVCLLNADKKAAYDEQLRRTHAQSTASELKAVAVASIPLADEWSEPAPLIHADVASHHPAPHRSHQTAHHKSSAPIAVTLGAAAAMVLLGALVWWLAGSESAQVTSPEPMQMAGQVSDGSGTAPAPPAAPQPEEPPAGADAPAAGDTPVTGLAEDPTSPPAEVPASPDDVSPDFGTEAQPDPPSPATEQRGLGDMLEAPDGPQEPSAEPAKPKPKPLPVKKVPVPDPAAQAEVRRMLDETYGTATAARSPDERLMLADRLAQLAGAAEDSTERFVLLRRASELASEGGDTGRTLQLVVRIADQFEVDSILAQAHLLDALSKKVASEEQIGALVTGSAAVVDAALAVGRYELADSLSASVYRASQAPAGRPFRVEALNRRRTVQELRSRWDEMQAALAVLESDPEDEAAHLILGRWHAFVRDDWGEALPHFTKGSDAALRALAHREANRATADTAGQVELADAWWDLAESSPAFAKSLYLQRAAHWYEQAQPKVTSPLVQTKVERRLEELQKRGHVVSNRPSAPPPPAVAPFDAKQAVQHQQAWAKHLNLPVEDANPIGMRLRLIPPGEFMMGSPDALVQAESRTPYSDSSYAQRLTYETPQHRVRITRPFWIGVTEVTQEQYLRVTGTNPARYRGPTLPVDRITWSVAMEFCRRLTQLSGDRLGGRVYRLPTEAEWEYACRAGTTTRYSFGDDDAMLGDHAWLLANTRGRLQPVATRKPNAWGLYDMHGNVWEWVLDWDSRDYYAISPVDDPLGAATGWSRVLRGGSASSTPGACRSAHRYASSSSYQITNLGFRVVLASPDEADKAEAAAERPNRRAPADF